MAGFNLCDSIDTDGRKSEAAGVILLTVKSRLESPINYNNKYVLLLISDYLCMMALKCHTFKISTFIWEFRLLSQNFNFFPR